MAYKYLMLYNKINAIKDTISFQKLDFIYIKNKDKSPLWLN